MSKNVTNIIKTIPTSMISVAKMSGSSVTTQAGTKTIVITAPKGTGGTLTTPTKIMTVPKLGGHGSTQFIVVSPQSAAGKASTQAILGMCFQKIYVFIINHFGCQWVQFAFFDQLDNISLSVGCCR